MSKINTLFVGKVLHALEVTASTNDFAQELLAKTEPIEGTVISAAFQQAGRGQIGSTWESERGKNLLLSIIFYPAFLPPVKQFLLNQVASLAVADATQEALGQPVGVKWPNDVYVGSRKVAGILIQNNIQGRQIRHTVIGIGLNVNQGSFSSLLPNPTSLFLEKGTSFPLESVRDLLLYKLEQRYLSLRAGRFDELAQDYQSRLFQLDVPARFFSAEKGAFAGTIRGVDPTGKLLIETTDGLLSFGFKEVRFEASLF